MIELNLELLEKTRKKLGFSHRYMSKELGYKSSATYYKIEVGITDPTLSQVSNICKILNLDEKKILR